MWTVIVRDAGGQVFIQQEWKEGSLTIGRGPGRDILLPSRAASRKHARLDLLNGTPVVVDEGSSNGTWVNGVRIAAPTRVDESSRIDVADFRITLMRAEDEAGKTAVLRAPIAAPARPAAADANAITAQLDRHIRGVRQYREQSDHSAQTQKQQLDHEWSQMIQALNGLKPRFSGDKRVLAFNISRDLKEITLKIADSTEKRGYRYFLLSREHPDGKFAGMDSSVWLREFGREDSSFHEPAKAMDELFSRIAGTLA